MPPAQFTASRPRNRSCPRRVGAPRCVLAAALWALGSPAAAAPLGLLDQADPPMLDVPAADGGTGERTPAPSEIVGGGILTERPLGDRLVEDQWRLPPPAFTPFGTRRMPGPVDADERLSQ